MVICRLDLPLPKVDVPAKVMVFGQAQQGRHLSNAGNKKMHNVCALVSSKFVDCKSFLG
jgi:hypothetical protein